MHKFKPKRLSMFYPLQEDHEIFDLVSALEAAEGIVRNMIAFLTTHARVIGKGTTFYSWLDVPYTASTSEIVKAYRKKSVTLQYVQIFPYHARN